MKAHKRKKRASIFENYQYNIMLSVMVGLAIIVICLSICAFLISLIDVSIGGINVLNSINLAIGSYVSGYVSAIKRQKSGIFSGALCGLLISLTIILLSSIFHIKGDIISKLCKIVICVVCSSIGGIKSANSHSI